MKAILTILSFVCLLVAGNLSAQSTNPRFKAVDDYALSVGKLDTLNAGTISYILTKQFADNTDKVRAIFTWIANNISLDVKAAKNSSNDKMTADIILKTRKANASGYATLFQDMCSVAKIRCLTVDGYTKKNVEQIGDKPDELNHTWVVVQLGMSPESWYYADPANASGYMDDKNTVFTRQFNDAFFFTDKAIFNYQHFADNPAWQLGASTAKSAKDFFAQPVVYNAAYEFGLQNFTPITGQYKTTTKKPAVFSLKVQPGAKIDLVALQIGPDKKRQNKTVDYRNDGGLISFSYKFEEEDSYPVKVLINNKPVLGYQMEITER